MTANFLFLVAGFFVAAGVEARPGPREGRSMAGKEKPMVRNWERMVLEVMSEVPQAGAIKLLSVYEGSKGEIIAHFEFDNGLRLLVLEDHDVPVVSFQTWFRVGSRYERPGRTGIAHLFEHLMFKGTKHYPHEVFDRLLEEAGAQTNAATWLDWTFYYENLPSEHWQLATRLEVDRMTNLVLTKEQLDSEREVVKNERRFRVENDPEGMIDETLMALVYGSHPYGHPTLGTVEDLEAITLEDCLDFYKTYYSPSNATIVVVGDVSTKEVLTEVGRLYGPIPRVEVPRVIPAPPAEQQEKRAKIIVLPVATERVRMAWRAVPANDSDLAALHVANGILFDDEPSRVYRRLVEKMKIASDVDGVVEAFELDGILMADVVMNEGMSSEEVASVVMDEVQKLASEGPSDRELERTKNATEAGFLRSIQSAGSKATQLGFFEITAGDYRMLYKFLADVRAVGPDDVRRVVSRYLSEQRLNVVIAKPAPRN